MKYAIWRLGCICWRLYCQHNLHVVHSSITNSGDVHGSILFNLVWRMQQNLLLWNWSYTVDIVCCYTKDRLLLCIKKLYYRDWCWTVSIKYSQLKWSTKLCWHCIFDDTTNWELWHSWNFNFFGIKYPGNLSDYYRSRSYWVSPLEVIVMIKLVVALKTVIILVLISLTVNLPCRRVYVWVCLRMTVGSCKWIGQEIMKMYIYIYGSKKFQVLPSSRLWCPYL